MGFSRSPPKSTAECLAACCRPGGWSVLVCTVDERAQNHGGDGHGNGRDGDRRQERGEHDPDDDHGGDRAGTDAHVRGDGTTGRCNRSLRLLMRDGVCESQKPNSAITTATQSRTPKNLITAQAMTPRTKTSGSETVTGAPSADGAAVGTGGQLGGGAAVVVRSGPRHQIRHGGQPACASEKAPGATAVAR